MYKKTIKYVDYDGEEREEDFYFNLTKAELIEMESSISGGLKKMIETAVASKDQPTIMRLFKDIVLKSYGVKSSDGKRFIKSEELSTEFSQTEAYSEMFMELATNADAAATFINGILPSVNPAVPAPAIVK